MPEMISGADDTEDRKPRRRLRAWTADTTLLLVGARTQGGARCLIAQPVWTNLCEALSR